MAYTDLLPYQTARALARQIRDGKVSSLEVVQAHLDRIATRNQRLNAVVVSNADAAVQRAEHADIARRGGETWGPLHGVPMTVKESFEMRGLPTTVNFKPLRGHVSSEDALVVTRLEEAGAIIIGKTNIPTLLAGYQTDGPIYGRTSNPYDHTRTPGGSTGGGAAALAADLTPLEIGSDIGGSIRVPAHYCGLYALKPTENVVPMGGHIPPLPGSKGGVFHLAACGPLARSIDDLQIAFEIIKGPDHRDANVPPIGWRAPTNRSLSEYRLAWTDSFGSYRADTQTTEQLTEIAAQAGRAGASISKQTPPGFNFERAIEAWGQIFGYIMAEDASTPIRLLMKLQWMAGRGPAARGMRNGLSVDFIDYARVLALRQTLISKIEAFLDEFDFWLCPVAMTPAFTHRRMGSTIIVDGVETDYHTAAGGLACVFNLTGHPVLVAPMGRSRDGLPIGLQIVGPYWSEPELIHFGRQLAELTPGFQPPPDQTPAT